MEADWKLKHVTLVYICAAQQVHCFQFNASIGLAPPSVVMCPKKYNFMRLHFSVKASDLMLTHVLLPGVKSKVTASRTAFIDNALGAKTAKTQASRNDLRDALHVPGYSTQHAYALATALDHWNSVIVQPSQVAYESDHHIVIREARGKRRQENNLYMMQANQNVSNTATPLLVSELLGHEMTFQQASQRVHVQNVCILENVRPRRECVDGAQRHTLLCDHHNITSPRCGSLALYTPRNLVFGNNTVYAVYVLYVPHKCDKHMSTVINMCTYTTAIAIAAITHNCNTRERHCMVCMVYDGNQIQHML